MEKEVRERFERIEALLDSLAHRHALAEARMDRTETRQDRTDARFEKRMRGFEKLAQIGLREIAKLAVAHKALSAQQKAFSEQHKALSEKVDILTDAQIRTDETLRSFIKSLRHPRNGG